MNRKQPVQVFRSFNVGKIEGSWNGSMGGCEYKRLDSKGWENRIKWSGEFRMTAL